MKKLNLIQSKKFEIEVIAKKYGASNIRIFGSVARGDDDDSSDIDILVTMASNSSLFDLGGLYSELQEFLGRRISIVTEGGLKGRFKRHVLKEAIPL